MLKVNKIKKVILILLSVVSINLYADISAPLQINQNTNLNDGQEKEIKNLQDFKNLENILLKAISMGDKSKSFALGSLYSQDFEFQKSDKAKSDKYFMMALSNGYGLSALPLIKSDLEQRKIDDALLKLEKGLKGQFTNLDSLVVLAVTYNGLILDNRYQSKEYVYRALDLTYPISQRTNVSSLDFTIANLLQLAGNYEEANKYLNTACNNPNADEVIKKACNNSQGISNNILKTTDCPTCGVLK